MPPISPMKDGATRKIVKSATLTPLRTLELNEVYQLITANKRLITLTQAIREAALQGDDNNCRMLKQQTLPYVTPLRRIHPTTERLPKATLRTGGGGRRPSRLT